MNRIVQRNRAVCVACALVFLLAAKAAHAQPAPGSLVLYGTKSGTGVTNQPINDDFLWMIDPTTGAGTPIGHMGIGTNGIPGELGAQGVGALAEHPLTHELYGITAPGFIPPSGTTRFLVKISKLTGKATVIGLATGLGATGFRFGIADITFRSDGTLFGWSENSDDLVTIDINTGKATIVSNAGISTFGSGLKFDNTGTLYLAGGGGNGNFFTVNPTTGLTTLLGALTGCPFPGFPIPALAIHPTTNVIYGINRTFPPIASGKLITINPVTRACTTIGDIPGRLDGLAWGTAPTPAAPGPTITSIPDQTLAMNTSITVPFTIAGDLLPTALVVTLASSNQTLLPSTPVPGVPGSALATSCDLTGACTLQITPEQDRVGSSLITVTVTDPIGAPPSNPASTSFTVTVTGVTPRPTAPGVVLANAVGSGIAVTWTAPGSGVPVGYAVAWGTSTGASNLPLQLVPGAVGRLDIAGVPPGTYFFRVYAIGGADVSAPSRETSVTVSSSSSVPGPPTALQAISAAGSLTTGWNAPFIGGTPTLYEVQVGSTLGGTDIADITTPSTLLTRSVSAGNYWVQTRASAGGANGAFSTAIQIPVSPPACTTAPAAPVLLPVTTTPGQIVFNWVTAGPADSYTVQVFQGATPLTTVNSVGAGTSAVWTASGAGAVSARVTAINACGTSAQSNTVTFTVP